MAKATSKKTTCLKVYTIIENTKGDGKGFWLEIGRAFVNKDGSHNVLLNALPVNGTLHIREQTAK